MSLRSLKRSIQRADDAYLKEHGVGKTNLSPSDKSIIVNLARNGITPADLIRARDEARKQAYADTAPAVLQVAYAAMGVVLHDEFGFSKDDVLKALRCIDDKIVLTIDTEEIENELEEKCEIRIRSKEGIGRIEAVH